MPEPTTYHEMQTPFFIDVVTRSTANPDEPPRRHRINFHSHRAREWLAKHSWWAIHNEHSVTTAPSEGN